MERCYATVRFFGPTLDHRAVTALLGRDPSYAYLPNEHRNRLGRAYPHGMWQLTSEKHVASVDLDEHIVWLLDQLKDAAHSLPDYLHSIEAEGDIDCYWEKEGNGGAFFNSSLLKRIADLGLGLGVTIYYIDDDSGESGPTYVKM